MLTTYNFSSLSIRFHSSTTQLKHSINHFIVVKTIKLTPRPRMALNGATLQQQLTVHNTGAEQGNYIHVC